jgi:HEAT repeat protein
VAGSLRNLGEADVQYIPDILNLLQDETVDLYVRESAAIALGNLGEAVTQYIPEILHFIQLDLKVVHFLVANLLLDFRRLDLNEVVYILNNADNTYWRFLTYFLSGGTDEVKTLLKWVGSPKSTPTALNYPEGKKTLELFLQVWDNAQDLPQLQNDLAEKIAVVTRLVSWQSQDSDVLQRHYNNLKAGNFSQADTVESVIQDLRSTKRGVKISPSDWKSRNQTKQSPLDKD